MNKRTYEGMMTVSENEKTGEKLPETAQLGEADIRRLQDDLPNDEVLYDLAELFRVFGDSTRIKICMPCLRASFASMISPRSWVSRRALSATSCGC